MFRGRLKSLRRLKPRLYKPSPPQRTHRKSRIFLTGEGRFCLYSCDFSRQANTNSDFSNTLLGAALRGAELSAEKEAQVYVSQAVAKGLICGFDSVDQESDIDNETKLNSIQVDLEEIINCSPDSAYSYLSQSVLTFLQCENFSSNKERLELFMIALSKLNQAIAVNPDLLALYVYRGVLQFFCFGIAQEESLSCPSKVDLITHILDDLKRFGLNPRPDIADNLVNSATIQTKSASEYIW